MVISAVPSEIAARCPLCRAQVAATRLPTRQNLRQTQVHATEFGLGGAIELCGIRIPPSLIGDQRGMEGIDAAEPLAVEVWVERGQCGIGVAAALLCPGDQQRLQQLRQALPRECVELLLRCLPMTGAGLHRTQQQLGGLTVWQPAGKRHGLAATGDQSGTECLLQQLGIVRLGGERTQKLAGRDLWIRLAHREPANHEIGEHAGRALAPKAACRLIRGGIRRGAG